MTAPRHRFQMFIVVTALATVFLLGSCTLESPAGSISTFMPTAALTPTLALTPTVTPTQPPTFIPTVEPTPRGGGGEVAFMQGGRITFYEIGTGKIVQPTIRIEGNDISSEVNSVSLSSDGKKIAFAAGRCPNRAPGQSVIWCNKEIYTANADGSNVVELTRNSLNDAWPVWSPDGTKVAWVTWQPYVIHVMNADGSEPKRLTDNRGWELSPAWSPDGKRIAFASQRPGYFQIYIMNADRTGGVFQLTKIKDMSTDPAWSPDGSRIAFDVYSLKEQKSYIYVIDADGSNPTKLTSGRQPIWSPDGKLIVFICTSGLCAINADGIGTIDLPNTSGGEGWLSWAVP